MESSPTRGVLRPLYRAALLADGAGLSDGELLDAFVARREDVYFEALVRRHGSMVLGVCRRILRNGHDAEDAFQAVFLVLARRAACVRPRQQVANWLHGVAYRTALEARRRAARRRARERQVNDMPHPRVETDQTWHDWLPVLDRELDRLPAKYRAPIVLCHLEGRTRKEAARHLGVPVGTLSGRLTTALRLLAQRMRRHGPALSGAVLAAALAPSAASASVPASLIAGTLKAALVPAAGQAVSTAAASTEVAALAKGVLKGMLVAKLKLATAVLVTLAVLGGGTSGFAYLTLVPRPADRPSDARAENESEKPETPRQEPPAPVAASDFDDNPESKKTDRERLQGTWIPFASEVDGKKVAHDDPKLTKWKLLFTGNTVTLPGSQEVAYTLDVSKQPREMDIAVKEPISPLRAIYELDGDRLKLSYIKSGERPTDFDTSKNRSVLIVFKRRESP